MKQVLVGAARWQVDRWQSEYYPEDLPVEWQLSFYANEFNTVLLDCRHYNDTQSMNALGEMLEDCHEGFRPVLYVAVAEVEPKHVERLLQWLEALDADMGSRRLSGICLSGLNECTPEVLSSWRKVIPAELPIALDGVKPIQLRTAEWGANKSITATWNNGPYGQEHAWLAMISLQQQPRELAQQLALYLQQLPDSDCGCVIARDGYDDIDRLHELVTLIRLING